MSKFVRRLDESVIEKLLESDLFVSKLKSDLENGIVFMTIRNEYVSFYFKGCGLFKFRTDQYSTNIKYAFIPSQTKSSYVTAKELLTINPVSSFVEAYDKIKQQCSLYKKPEPFGVSSLYKNSVVSKIRKSDSIYLLDIEVGFSNNDIMPEDRLGRTKDDRIDILLYDNEKKSLCFWEAKDCSNIELNLKGNPKEAPVIHQIERYNKQISENKANIIEQYANQIRIMNRIFNSALSAPADIFPKVGLYAFGYRQKEEKDIQDHIKGIGQAISIPFYTKGKPASVDIDTLYRSISK